MSKKKTTSKSQRQHTPEQWSMVAQSMVHVGARSVLAVAMMTVREASEQLRVLAPGVPVEVADRLEEIADELHDMAHVASDTAMALAKKAEVPVHA